MKDSNNSGVGFGGALTLLFIGLKLTGYISWSWWWVFAPIWMPIVVIILFVALAYVAALPYAFRKRN